MIRFSQVISTGTSCQTRGLASTTIPSASSVESPYLNTPVSVDLTAQFLFYERLWLGVMYRLGDAVGGMIQMQVTNQLKVGYAYDITATDLGTYNNGTHEILVSYDFNFGRGKVRSPRYF